ncbi:MAG: NAD-dependent epimerase/dehydratase [Microgenomates group bacterium Gr01-1014_7]|nr:MAG: NAD-dependent epimerase/dehydratase [Microgenomates group bacterium Gr01-1014_7]
MKQILITGGAGFIGSNLINKLIEDPNLRITCLDNFDPFYNSKVKKENIKPFLKNPNFNFIQADIRNFPKLKSKLTKKFDIIIHLAAKVGIGSSLVDPKIYTEVNIGGTQNLLELAKQLKCKQFIFASSSSVYGVNPNVPWREDDRVLMPINPYGFTKISGELLGQVYSKLYNLQFIGLRFFSVYGPKQRPDLVIHKFTKLISKGKPITIYGEGKTKRDYTFIDDVVSGIVATLDYSSSQYEIINLGNNEPVELLKLVQMLEKVLGKKAKVFKLPEQLGDPPITFADISKAQRILNYQPRTSLLDGLQKYISWFKGQNEKSK